MARSRWLIAPAALVALAGCGSSTQSSSISPDATTATTVGAGGPTTTIGAVPGSPAVIHLSSAGGSQSPGAGRATPTEQGNGADGAIEPMPIQPSLVTYVTRGDLPALGGTGPSWRLPSGAQPDLAQIARVARALGVQGAPSRLTADQGGGVIVGSDGTGPTLQVNADGLLSWWYNPAATAAPAPPELPQEPGGSGGAPTAGSTGQGSTGSGGSPASTGSAGAPAESQPPAGVPTRDEATARARALLTAMGLDPAGYQFDAYADQWGASVTAWRLLDGRRSPLSTNFGFGAGGALTWAGGTLATPVRGADYPLVGTDVALARLNDQQAQWLAISGGGSTVTRDVAAGTGTASSAGSAGATGSAGTAGSPGTGQTSGSDLPPQMMPPAEGPAPTTASTLRAPGPADRAPENTPPSAVSESCPAPVPDVQAPKPGPDTPVSSGTHQPLPSPGAPDTPCVPISVSIAPTRVTVTLTGVANDLSTVSDQAGNVWILPAYTFHDDSGATYTVLSVADRYLDLATR